MANSVYPPAQWLVLRAAREKMSRPRAFGMCEGMQGEAKEFVHRFKKIVGVFARRLRGKKNKNKKKGGVVVLSLAKDWVQQQWGKNWRSRRFFRPLISHNPIPAV
mmetsp:Transcript_2058/g.4440  ORF Transcript_2058/g.4440 Transcript_2058/m.4440 type:complete len:105 (-) Transcript_2058:878-1192(-)